MKFDDKKKRILIPVVFLTGIILVNMYFLHRYGRMLINSDNALIAAKTLNDAGDLFVTNEFLYPTQMFISPLSFIPRLMLSLFSDSWMMARMSYTLLYYLVMIACHVYLFRQFDSIPQGLWTSFLALCPVGVLYARMSVWVPGYMTYVIHITFTVALLFHQRKMENTAMRKTLLVLNAAFAVFQGLSGVRMPMLVYTPLFLSAAFLYLFYLSAQLRDMRDKQKWMDTVKQTLHTESFSYMAVTFFLGVMSGVGLFFCNNVLSKQYSFRTYTGVSIKLKKIGELLDDFLSLFGETKGITTFNIHYLAYWLGQIFVIAALILILRYCIETSARSALSVPEQRFLWFFVSGLLICFVIYGNAWDLYSGGGWYFLHLIPQVFAAVLIILSHISRIRRLVCTAAVSFVCLFCSVSSMKNPWIPGQADSRFLIEVADYLAAEGYTQGLATFWNSNAVTDLTNGQIEMWTMGYTVEEYTNCKMYAWMQKASHLRALPEGRVFVLLNGPELEQFDYTVIWDHAVYVGDNFVAFGFDDIADYINAVGVPET